MDVGTLARIKGDPNYQTLIKERGAFGWTLAIIMLVLYYGFIAYVAFDPAAFGVKVSGTVTVGLIVGAGLIVISILLTGIYVVRANTRYDALTRAIVANATGPVR
jgi:uncharacterized membrane protein (DUF485 family)